MLEKARFADSTYGAKTTVRKKVAEGRPSARLGAFSEITKKTGVSVRVMREMSHRLVISFERHHQKMLEKARFADSTYAARLSVTKKVAEGRPSARLDELSQITKKAVPTVRFSVKCHTVLSFFSKYPFFW